MDTNILPSWERQVVTGKKERGYCFLCMEASVLEEILEPSGYKDHDFFDGWRCGKCGAISAKPHKVCPKNGASCTKHPPLEKTSEKGTGNSCFYVI